MTDREGLKSTISLRHGQSKGTGRSLHLDGYGRAHGVNSFMAKVLWISEVMGKKGGGEGGSSSLGHPVTP
jgi:hypothetical protein